jgi:hypothetical protein
MARAAMLLFIVMLLGGSSTRADEITTEQALQQAQTFVKNHQTANGSRRNAPGAAPQLTLASKVSGLYVFNVASDGGFVIVSNDDRTTPILAFGDSGNIDPDNMPENMRAWLQGYADEIAWLKTQSGQRAQSRAPQRIGNHATNEIRPLVATQWNQNAPFNNMTPYYGISNGQYVYSKTEVSGYNHCVTGCVATAMAQVMKYHNWPEGETAQIPAYKWRNSIWLPDENTKLPATTFVWSNMKNKYTGSETDETATAVATLMKYCGYSLEMNYGSSSSASDADVANALITYFGYNDQTTQFVRRNRYTYANWTDLIYFELAHQRPVVYGGQSSGGGHAFVCDGYKYENETDYFHINWGWGGMSDEYYVLSSLNPYNQGIGGSSSNDGYRYDQDAIIGIQPSNMTGEMSTIQLCPVDYTLNSMTLSQDIVTVNTPVSITLNVTNNSSVACETQFYVGVNTNWFMTNGAFAFEANETKDCVINFTPTATGTYELIFVVPVNGDQNNFSSYNYGQTFATLIVDNGETPRVPTCLSVTDVLSRSVVLDWTENGDATTWKVAYKTAADANFTELDASAKPFTITGLTPATTYTVKVGAVAESSTLWSQEMTFTTDIACPVPTGLAVSDVYPSDAILSWQGAANSYEVRYGLYTGGEPQWLKYDNGDPEGGLSYGLEETTWGVMFPGDQITSGKLTKVAIYESAYYNTEDITVKIYSGGDTAPGELLYSEVVSTEHNSAFHEVTLSLPVNVSSGENLWITLTEKGAYPLMSCSATGVSNQWCYDGYRWFTVNNVCWMIRGYIDTFDPDAITWTTTTSTNEECQLLGLKAEKDYAAQVRGNYGDDGYSEWNTLIFTTPINDLDELTLADDGNTNSTLIANNSGVHVNVTLTDRILYKDGEWNTICLPFNVDLTDEDCPLYGAEAKTLTDASMTGTTVSLTFGTPVDVLEAGIPYIIKWENSNETINSPRFESVIVKSPIDNDELIINLADGHVKFIGYYDAFGITAANYDTYYMTAGSTLKHTAKDRTLKAFRAYFLFSEIVANQVREFILDFGDGETTGITNTIVAHEAEGWYTLDGMKMDKQPKHKGVYIKDGKKVVIQ